MINLPRKIIAEILSYSPQIFGQELVPGLREAMNLYCTCKSFSWLSEVRYIARWDNEDTVFATCTLFSVEDGPKYCMGGEGDESSDYLCGYSMMKDGKGIGDCIRVGGNWPYYVFVNKRKIDYGEDDVETQIRSTCRTIAEQWKLQDPVGYEWIQNHYRHGSDKNILVRFDWPDVKYEVTEKYFGL